MRCGAWVSIIEGKSDRTSSTRMPVRPRAQQPHGHGRVVLGAASPHLQAAEAQHLLAPASSAIRRVSAEYQKARLRACAPAQRESSRRGRLYVQAPMPATASAAARFNNPICLGLLPNGDLVVTDCDNSTIRVVVLQKAVSTVGWNGRRAERQGGGGALQLSRGPSCGR